MHHYENGDIKVDGTQASNIKIRKVLEYKSQGAITTGTVNSNVSAINQQQLFTLPYLEPELHSNPN